jgi:DNA-binding NarL/FixJ family response regulator
MLICDDQFALVPATVTARAIETTFVIHRSPILDALIALFEAEWAQATPIPGVSPAAASGAPDSETAALLAMLAAGMTDASIARSLSWSMRTTQRRMRQLMTDLGVTSRFQAGVAAREKGWL